MDATAARVAKDEYKLFTNLVRDLVEGYTADVEKARVIFRSDHETPTDLSMDAI